MKYSGMLSEPSIDRFWCSLGSRTSSQRPPRCDDLARLLVAHPLQQRLVHELAEILLVEAHEHAVGQHGDGGVALGFGDQRFFAEGVADAELGELDAFAVERRLARHDALAAAR